MANNKDGEKVFHILSVKPNDVGCVFGQGVTDGGRSNDNLGVGHAVFYRVAEPIIINKQGLLHLLLEFLHGINIVFIGWPAGITIRGGEVDFTSVNHKNYRLSLRAFFEAFRALSLFSFAR